MQALLFNLMPFLTDIDAEVVKKAKTLEEFDARENPLTLQTYDALSKVKTVTVTLTPRELEEWEDLTVWDDYLIVVCSVILDLQVWGN